MNKHLGNVIAKGIPILIIIYLGKTCYFLWWEFFDQTGFYENSRFLVCFPPSRNEILIQAIILSLVILVTGLTILNKPWSYKAFKVILTVLLALSLYRFLLDLTLFGENSEYWEHILDSLIEVLLIRFGLFLWGMEKVKLIFYKNGTVT